jgi:hypothetical protein
MLIAMKVLCPLARVRQSLFRTQLQLLVECLPFVESDVQDSAQVPDHQHYEYEPIASPVQL